MKLFAPGILQNFPKCGEYKNTGLFIQRFLNTSRGTRLGKSAIRDAYARIRKTANVPNFTTHVCRHTFVTRLCEQKVSAKAIAQIIGHAKTDYVLNIYAQLEKDALRKAIFSLEDMKKGATTADVHLKFTDTTAYQQIIRAAYDMGLPIDRYIMKLIEDNVPDV